MQLENGSIWVELDGADSFLCICGTGGQIDVRILLPKGSGSVVARALESTESAQTAPNERYATALELWKLYWEKDAGALNAVNFGAWCKERLNTSTSHNG